MLVHKRIMLIYEQDSYEKNYRTLMKEIKKRSNKEVDIPC